VGSSLETTVTCTCSNGTISFDTTHSTSIPPHSDTRDDVRSDARTASTPTTSVQNVVPSSEVARAAAGAQRPT
jgi:hypothetical protein